MARGFKNSVENVFNRMLLYSILVASVTFIIGLVLLFLPSDSIRIAGRIGGIVFILSGINSIYKYFHRDGAKLYSLNLVFGLIHITLGLIIMLYPYKAMEFVTACLGLYIVINGASKANYALWLKKGNEDSWLVTLATGILLAIIGLLVIFVPLASLKVTQTVGAFLTITAVLDFMDAILFKKRSKEIMEIFW